ncbi:MAG: cobaltochelatase subunit CobN [Rhodospirillales bacterium]
MHLLVRETRSLDEAEPAVDLEQSPADLVFLSFTDSDLAAVASAPRPAGVGLRLASLARLRHPLSTDLYIEKTVLGAKAVVVRILGGLDYWRYGAEELARCCREAGIPLALLPGDARPDPRLTELSTLPAADLAALDRYFVEGGQENLGRLLRQAAFLGGRCEDPAAPAQPLPQQGFYRPGQGAVCKLDLLALRDPARPLAVLVFYRSYLLAGDLAAVDALIAGLEARGFDVWPLFVASLKAPDTAGWCARLLAAEAPAVVVNVTAFSAQREAGGDTPLEAAGAPVLQAVLAGSDQRAWQESDRGLAASDLAMQVVLPELDGRLVAGVISFKAKSQPLADLEFTVTRHRPYAPGIAAVAAKAAAWAKLAATPRAERHLGLILSDYPGGGGQIAHAVGLDALASTGRIAALLRAAGYDLPAQALDSPALAQALEGEAASPFLSLAAYRDLWAALPAALRERVEAAWGAPESDPTLVADHFTARWLRHGRLLIALQPDRGDGLDRKASYHDPDQPPRHAYIAFYLWLREVEAIDAMIHLGTHGTLEWLPGKSVALSPDCAPAALTGALPVIYPFIVNNPGEAAAAKRRLSAVTLGHLTPPLKSAGTQGPLAELERLVDDYAAADGLDQRRMSLLRQEIRRRAEETGLGAECGVTRDMPDDEALAQLDTYLCDVKDLQIRDGLHIFGQAPEGERAEALAKALCCGNRDLSEREAAARIAASGREEAQALLRALDGGFIPPGPAGAPTRGRADVLPSGRNLVTVDPRAVPTRSALLLGKRAADELIRRHLQEEGDWPRALVIDLWGSATMRTGGDELAMALVLLGVEPTWDEGSNRVSGFEVLPLARLERPRVDVTLRISGLFRDVFQTQIALFDRAVAAVAERDEAADMNPLAAACRGLTGAAKREAAWRIFGSAPGVYEAGVTGLLDRGAWETRAELAESYLAAGGYAYGREAEGVAAKQAFSRRVQAADALVHLQDHREVDLLDSTTYAAFEGGFAAASAALGGAAQVYHTDIADPEAPKARTLQEELVRVVRGRAANPTWLAGMMRHGYRGGAEMAKSLDSLFAFAATSAIPLSRQFDLLYEATLGDATVEAFLAEANPAARAAMRARFAEALRRELWQPRRNAVAGELLDPES